MTICTVQKKKPRVREGKRREGKQREPKRRERRREGENIGDLDWVIGGNNGDIPLAYLLGEFCTILLLFFLSIFYYCCTGGTL
jgi:hypothetical protein